MAQGEEFSSTVFTAGWLDSRYVRADSHNREAMPRRRQVERTNSNASTDGLGRRMKPTRWPSASATAAYAATGMLDMKRSGEDSLMKTLHACGSQSGATNRVKPSWTNAETAVASAICAERITSCMLPDDCRSPAARARPRYHRARGARVSGPRCRQVQRLSGSRSCESGLTKQRQSYARSPSPRTHLLINARHAVHR